MTAPLNPDKFPDVRPDRLRFWSLRLLAWLLVLVGLGAIGFGGVHGTLAYYGTKNGAEVGRIVASATWFGASVGAGLLLLLLGQIARVLLAIEENTRLIAYNTRQRPRAAESAPERRTPLPERIKA